MNLRNNEKFWSPCCGLSGDNSKGYRWGLLDPKQVYTTQHASLRPQNSREEPPKHQTPRVSLFFLEIGSNEQTTHSITKHRCCAFSPTSLTWTLYSIHVTLSCHCAFACVHPSAWHLISLLTMCLERFYSGSVSPGASLPHFLRLGVGWPVVPGRQD